MKILITLVAAFLFFAAVALAGDTEDIKKRMKKIQDDIDHYQDKIKGKKLKTVKKK